MVTSFLSTSKPYLTHLELDKARSGGSSQRTEGSSGSLFGSKSSIPSELTPLVSPQQALTKALLVAKTPLVNAKQDYEKMTDPAATIPTAPVHAARLNGLLKTLAIAEGAVAEGIKARKLLIQGLEKLLSTNQAALLADEAQAKELAWRWSEIDAKKKNVEDSIMRGMGNSNPNSPVVDQKMSMNSPPQQQQLEPDRPVVEALTPPGYPKPPTPEVVPEFKLEDIPAYKSEPVEEPVNLKHEEQNANANGNGNGNGNGVAVLGADLMGSLSGPSSYGGAYGSASVKKRKLGPGDEIPDLGDELDADVAAMLNS